jgi:cysteine synthase B
VETLKTLSEANPVGVIKVAEKLNHGTVVTMLPDNADKYKDIIKKLL